VDVGTGLTVWYFVVFLLDLGTVLAVIFCCFSWMLELLCTVRTVPKSNRKTTKYHTVRTVPKSNRKTTKYHTVRIVLLEK
jgi:hypothetical protein